MLELLKDMKKVAEDAKTVTMQHPKGHSIVLVLKGLPIVQKEALKRIPLHDGGKAKIKKEEKKNFDEGGSIPDSSPAPANPNSPSSMGVPHGVLNAMSSALGGSQAEASENKAKGGKIQKFDEGGAPLAADPNGDLPDKPDQPDQPGVNPKQHRRQCQHNRRRQTKL
jgi:hypothetical protein